MTNNVKLDYQKFLKEYRHDNASLEIWQSASGSDRNVEIGGTKNGLLYLACRIAEFALEDSVECDCAELNLDAGIHTTDDSSFLTVFLLKK